MKSRVVCLFLIGVFTFRAAAQDVESVSQAGGPTVEDLVMTILDPASGLTIVGQITPQNNTQIAGSTQLTDPRAMACFEAGEVGVAGTLLPPENQNAAGDAAYVGGIGIDVGVVLCTGMVTDDLSLPEFGWPAPGFQGRGIGVEGPSNGVPIQEGSYSFPAETDHKFDTPFDEDLDDLVFESSRRGGNAAVLEFTVNMPTPGYIRVSVVFGSDEYPNFVDPQIAEFNDAFAIFVEENPLQTKNIATFVVQGNPQPFALKELVNCDVPLF